MQTTIARKAKVSGLGLDTGGWVRVVFRPASADTGIVFRRVDVKDHDGQVPARFDSVVETKNRTVIANSDGVRVSMIEHAMAAFSVCGVDNLLVEVDGPELPIFDGSALPYAEAIRHAGLRGAGGERRAIRMQDRVEFRMNGAWVALEPAGRLEISFEIDFTDTAIGRQHLDLPVRNGAAVAELLPARTFGTMSDVERLRGLGQLRGASLASGIVIEHGRILNPEGLRFKDEFVRHKMVDALGDLFLSGCPIIGRCTGHRPGHGLNNGLLRTLFANRGAWFYEGIPAPTEYQGPAS